MERRTRLAANNWAPIEDPLHSIPRGPRDSADSMVIGYQMAKSTLVDLAIHYERKVMVSLFYPSEHIILF